LGIKIAFPLKRTFPFLNVLTVLDTLMPFVLCDAPNGYLYPCCVQGKGNIHLAYTSWRAERSNPVRRLP
jgi:hypothetical protein